MSSKVYKGDYLDRVAFPMGGIGAGMLALEGSGALSHLSIRNQPNVFSEPCTFSALCIKGKPESARILEGPIPRWKTFGTPGSGNGIGERAYGLPRMSKAEFNSRFPFATVKLEDKAIPFEVEITGWSPFIPGDADNSSMPVAGLEYKFTNPTSEAVEAVYSFNTRNFMNTNLGGQQVLGFKNGLILWQPGNEEKPWDEGTFCACVDTDDAVTDLQWFRGGWFDNLTLAWKNIQQCNVVAKPVAEGDPSPGGTIFVPFTLGAKETRTIRLMFSWYVPQTNITVGPLPQPTCDSGCGCGCKTEIKDVDKPRHQPWYAGRFGKVEEVAEYWKNNYDDLKVRSRQFSDCFFDTTLPEVVVEAVEANLTILKSPTVLRQPNGDLWCWEGCHDTGGCCSGSCTHVWNYAQALPHLFPSLERTLRQTEFNESQDERGHQNFRSALPIRPTDHGGHAAADGQLGGIIKIYREWRISGDTEWLKGLWPKVKESLNYCIELWDPEHEGCTKEPHHNTYDIEFWGPDGMCTSIYLGALTAASLMGKALGEDVQLYNELLEKGLKFIDAELFNGEYYIQKVQWTGLRAGNPLEFHMLAGGGYSPEAQAILEKEGPKYQYGNGCLSDGVIGFWMAEAAGLGKVGNVERIKSHLASIHKYNLKKDLSTHSNPQRPAFALGDEGGLLLCSWPHGDKLSLPFVYSDEVWTGIEYQVAAHAMMNGLVQEGLDIVEACRERYDGKKRNPYNEYECGHWYARAMASYATLQGLTGVRYDAVDKVIYVQPSIKGDFRSFLSTETGYGTVGVKDGKPFVNVCSGDITIDRIEYSPAE